MKELSLGKNGQLMVDGKAMEMKFPKPEEGSSEKKKAREVRMRWKDGSYLTTEQEADEEFQIKAEIF